MWICVDCELDGKLNEMLKWWANRLKLYLKCFFPQISSINYLHYFLFFFAIFYLLFHFNYFKNYLLLMNEKLKLEWKLDKKMCFFFFVVPFRFDFISDVWKWKLQMIWTIWLLSYLLEINIHLFCFFFSFSLRFIFDFRVYFFN